LLLLIGRLFVLVVVVAVDLQTRMMMVLEHHGVMPRRLTEKYSHGATAAMLMIPLSNVISA